MAARVLPSRERNLSKSAQESEGQAPGHENRLPGSRGRLRTQWVWLSQSGQSKIPTPLAERASCPVVRAGYQ